MTILTEKNRAAEFLLSEGNGQISRESITVVAGNELPAGQVVGIITASGKYTIYDNVATDGSEVAAGILYAPLDTSASDRNGVAIVRMAEVAEARLTGLDTAGKADLKTRNIIVR